ncbi:MAG: hypothetical protein COB35_05285 [Gammaproteobacteria bacterium]|nr:MAG: hypothetical protein COB35_05285 [Gammaproteobacteria bacterium]
MNIKSTFLAALLLSTTFLNNAQAGDIKYSFGTGYPFYGVAEVSFPAFNDDQRFFVNYKIGGYDTIAAEDAFSAGFEQLLDGKNNQTVGFTIGAIGVRDGTKCDQDTGAGDVFRCEFGKLFSSEVTNGAALNYSYYFNGVHNSGTKIRFELGYGQSSKTNTNRVDGSVILSYQF